MPILDAHSLEFISRSAEQTRRIGARLGSLLTGGEVIALEGNLGCGKTVLAQGIGQGWGTTTRLISPTFVLLRRHESPQHITTKLYHIDLYRLANSDDVESIGVYDLIGDQDAICLIEWPERASDLFDAEYLWVSFDWLSDYRRSLIFRANGARHQALLDEFRKEIVGR
ncbi:MAG: tRNA (adenosine(37)-N6)-threonylcarbamoyltransferase complex ATPase subunit type 1 TsaE [Anaerolineae bacterium]|nr:tRNA (adenosine(37)-N6)-threonylcarbamoyltransferase complex ATPase subunit type 1 TsaE [Anaerolineae bacterium]